MKSSPPTVRIADLLYQRRVLFFVLGLVLVVLGMSGLKHFVIKNDYRSYFKDGNMFLDNTDWLSNRLGDSGETILLIYKPHDEDVFSSLSILQYLHIAREAKTLPYSTDVSIWLDIEKLIKVEHPNKKEAEYKAAPFNYGLDLFSEEDRAILRADALNTPAIAGRYVSRDGKTAAAIITVDIESTSAERLSKIKELKDAVADLQADLQKAAPHDQLVMAGSTLFDYAAFETLRHDVRRLFPVAFLLITAILFFLYRSPLFVCFCLVLIFVPVLVTAGLISALGFSFSTLSISGLLLVGTLAVADIIHISNSFFLFVHQKIPKEEAIKKALEKNLWAVTATTITTALGQLAMLFSASPPVQVMGAVVMVGAFTALILAVMIMPFLLSQLSPKKEPAVSALSKILANISLRCHNNPVKTLSLSALIMAVMLAGIAQSRVTDSMSGWFAKDTDFRQAMDLVDAGYLGGDTLTISLEMLPKDMVSARSYPNIDDRLQSYLDFTSATKEAGGAGDWVSLAESLDAAKLRIQDDTVSTAFRVVASDDTDSLKKFTADTVSKSGLLTPFEMGQTDYSLWFFDSALDSSFDLLDKVYDIQDAALANADGREVKVGGIGPAFANLSVMNYASILNGSVIAFTIISLVLIFIFRSLKMGALSVIPNLAPIVFAYGVWGWCVGDVNLAAITVFSVAMGIVVDDTIHVIVMYRRAVARGLSSADAVEDAIRGCGTGLLTTTLIIAGGFFLLSLSGFLLTAHKALLVGTAISAAFVFDLTMLPALLGLVGRKKINR